MANFLDEAGLDELWALVKTQDGVVEALANTKAKIATGSYKGTGGSGSAKKVTLTVDFEPKFVAVSREGDAVQRRMANVVKNGVTLRTSTCSASGTDTYIVGGSNSVSFYSTNVNDMMNVSNATYHWVIFG